jgi:hypothetical protein
MSRDVQVTFDAQDPRALSSFWRDVLGYVHPEVSEHLPSGDAVACGSSVPQAQRSPATWAGSQAVLVHAEQQWLGRRQAEVFDLVGLHGHDHGTQCSQRVTVPDYEQGLSRA